MDEILVECHSADMGRVVMDRSRPAEKHTIDGSAPFLLAKGADRVGGHRLVASFTSWRPRSRGIGLVLAARKAVARV